MRTAVAAVSTAVVVEPLIQGCAGATTLSPQNDPGLAFWHGWTDGTGIAR